MRRKITNSVTYNVTTVGDKAFEIVHEFCDTKQGFAHRLRCNDKTGEWTSYQGIAELHYDSRKFCGVTDYFEVGGLVYYMNPGWRL